MVPFEVASSFGDIEVSGDKILLITEDGFCNFKNFFTDRDSVQYGRVNSYLVEKIFCDEDGDYWEPYSETYSKWYDDVWEDMVIPNKKLYEYISKYFKEEYVIPNEYNPKQLDIFGELPKSRKIYSIEDLMLDEGKRILDEEYFIWLKEHPEVTHWVAVDDLDMGIQDGRGLTNFVHCKRPHNEGIKQSGIKDKIINFLNS